MMSCYKCGTQFNKLFRKEHGCAKCGFAFCGRCCSQKIVLFNIDSEKKQLVCDKCFEDVIAEREDSITSAKYSPPAALQKRLDALAARRSSLKSKTTGSEKDELIAQRLQKLKAEEAVPQQHELEERLAKLKGLDPQHFTAPPITVYRPPDTRSTSQKADSLYEQVAAEVNLELDLPKPEEEIAARLASLRGLDMQPKPTTSKATVTKQVHKDYSATPSALTDKESDIDEVYQYLLQESSKMNKDAEKSADEITSDKLLQEELAKIQREQKIKSKDNSPTPKDEDEDESEANAIVEKILAETSLPDAPDSPPENGPASIAEDEQSDDFPWCVICTEDAKLRCLDCDEDLYCLRCFKECHDALELREHHTVVFKPKLV